MKPGCTRPGPESVGASLMPRSTKIGLEPGSTGSGLVPGPKGTGLELVWRGRLGS